MVIVKTMKKSKIFHGKRYTLYKEYVGETPAKMRRHFIAVEHPTWKQEIYRDAAMNVGLYVLKPKAKKKSSKPKKKAKPKCTVVHVKGYTRKCPTKKRR